MSAPIDDSARVHPLSMVLDENRKKNPPMACCPRDGAPLVCTFEFRGAEFICMECHGLFGWLAPEGKIPTPELEARLARHEADYERERKVRAAVADSSSPTPKAAK